jgi:putative endonuclease
MSYYVYILANRSRMLYVGNSNDLSRRLFEHKLKLTEGYTKKYSISRLVYYETYDTREAAEKRETQLKSWLRAKKIEMIERLNPTWRDLGFRFILPESKARQLLRRTKNEKLNGMQIVELVYKR